MRVSIAFEKPNGAKSELSDSYTILEGRIVSNTHFGRDVSDGLAMFKNPCKIHRHLRKDETRFCIGFCILKSRKRFSKNGLFDSVVVLRGRFSRRGAEMGAALKREHHFRGRHRFTSVKYRQRIRSRRGAPGRS